MTTFPAYATNFEFHPQDGEADRHLSPLLDGLRRIDFAFSVANASVNQGQTACDYWLLVTAYTTGRANRIEKLRKEYQAYKQAGPATLR